MARSKRELAMLTIAFIGILLAIYAIPLHYGKGGSLCDINATLSCDTVNKSTWSTLFGIPVAVLGFISYVAVFFIMFFRTRIQRLLSFTREDFAQYLLVIVGVMFAFQLYLTFVEAFVIRSYCIVCLASQVCIFLLAALALIEYRRS